MTLALFAYPSQPHTRRHGSAGYDPYGGYKPWLRDEFTFRCVYCLKREPWYPDGADSYSVEHVIPQSEDATLLCEYTNLLYACTRCNSARRDERLLDPTAVALGNHVRLGEDGMLIGTTVEGIDFIDILHLNENPALRVRRKYARILALGERFPGEPEVQTLYLEAFGFPDDIPDLRKRKPPRGNRLPGGAQSCYFAQREAGMLQATY